MSKLIRIGNAQAFWGDLPTAASTMLRQIPELDYLTMDYLAEVSMSILAVQKERHPKLGYARDFIRVVADLSDYWSSGGGCRLIANAGGLNPMECASACQKVLEERGCRSLKIALVTGDNVMDFLTSEASEIDDFNNLDNGRPLNSVRDRLMTANAYMSCVGIVRALEAGANIVITGRVADPSMVLAACVHHFGWALDDWDRLAQGTVAGHLLECGTQVTGGISTDWLNVPDAAHIGFPLVEVEEDGRCVVTKPPGTGGYVTEMTVKEQLIYEIGDPANYLSPDVKVSFLNLRVQQLEVNRVEVTGARGTPPPATLKVSATYRDGYRAAGTLTIVGHQSSKKAQRSAQVIFEKLRDVGWHYRDTLVEILGTGASVPLPEGVLQTSEPFETVMRLAVESDSKEAVEAFSQYLMSLVTAGAQGTTGYAEGRPRVHSVFRYWPCLIAADRISASVQVYESQDTQAVRSTPPFWPAPHLHGVVHASSDAMDYQHERVVDEKPSRPGRLIDIAFGRSGDKGTGANVGILVRNMRDYPNLVQWLTCQRVSEFFGRLNIESIKRFELANLGGVNFVLAGVLKPGIRNDAQGKALAQALLAMPLTDWPGESNTHAASSATPIAKPVNMLP